MQNFILLHGALGFSGDLAGLSDVLERTGNTVYAFTFSGHGGQAFGPAFGIDSFASELHEYIIENKIYMPVVFGYSMGGFVALYLASQQKEVIKKIITLGTKFNWSKESVDKETRMLNPEIMLEKVPAFAKALENKHGKDWKALVTKTADLMREIHEKDFLNPEVLHNLNTPVLIGLADKDQMVTLDETYSVFKNLPKASMYMLPDSKHALESINHEILANILIDFVLKE